MQNITQIQLIPQVSGNTQVGIIDITEDTIIPITFSVSDVRDLTQKNGTFSKSIKVKGTKNNNKIFQFYFDVNLRDENISFNINKLAFCNVIQNGVVIMDNALIQLVSVNKKQETNLYDDEVEYQLVIKDTASDFFNIINNRYLEDINLNLPNDLLTPQRIIDSFDNTVEQGFKYILGYAGGGTDANSAQANDAIVNVEEFKPAIFAKKYFDEIFFNAGYKYDWQSIDSPLIRFSKMLIPYNGDDAKGDNVIDSSLVNLQSTTTPTGHQLFSSSKVGKIPESSGNFKFLQPAIPEKLGNFSESFDPNGLFNPATQLFTVPTQVEGNKSNVSVTINYDLEIGMINNEANPVRLKSSYLISDGNTTGSIGVRPYVRLINANGTVASDPFMLAANNGISQNNNTTYPAGTTILNSTVGNSKVVFSNNLFTGEQFYIEINLTCNTNGDINWDFNDRIFDTHPPQSQIKYLLQNTSTNSYNTNARYYVKLNNLTVQYDSHIDNGYSYNKPVRLNQFIPQKIKQSDFIKSIALMYNLYFEVDKINSKLIHIYTRDDFYDSGVTVDWTQKLDKGTEQELRFLPELQNKQFLLTYKPDTDYANELYYNSVNEIYSQFLYVFDNNYVKDVKRVELSFSPTPMYFHNKLNAVLPFINGLEPKNNIRILYDGGERPCNQYKIQSLNQTTNNVEAALTTSLYPLASHWNEPTNADFSIEFGTNDYYFLTNNFGEVTDNNLYNMHWRRTLDTINTGRMFTGYFNLNEDDIATLRLNQKVICHNSIWVINRVIDYDGNSQKLTKVELINIDSKEPQPIFKKQPKRTDLFNNFGDLFNRWNLLRTDGLLGGLFTPIRSGGFGNLISNPSGAIGKIIGSNNNLSGSGWLLGDDNAIITRIGGFNNILGNGNNTLSDNGFIFGSGNRVEIDNNFSNLWGNNNFVASSNTNTNIWGDFNILSSNTRNSFILGSENIVDRDNTNVFVLGTGNTVNSGLSKVYIFGNDLTGTTSNTSYFDNIIITSGSTINNIPIQAYMGGYNDTGVIDYTGITVASSTQINIPPIAAWFVDNETNPLVPTKERVIYTGQTNVTVPTLSAGFATYVFLRKDKTIFFQNTFPTSAERKTMCFLGKLGHPNGLINVGLNSPDFATSPNAQTRDMWKAFGFINRGVLVTPVSGLTIGRTAGTLYGNGVSFHLQPTIPNEFFVTAQTASQMFYRTQTGGTTGVVGVLDPANYDAGGVVTPIGGGVFNSTIQYVFAVPGAQQYVIQYGQNIYFNLADAVAAVGKESFAQFPSLVHNGVLLGVIALTRSATNVNDPAEVRFFNSDIFGQLVGAAGGSPTTSLQGAYNNSSNPEIVENSTLRQINIRGWDNAQPIMEFENTATSTVATIWATGMFSGASDSFFNDVRIGRGGGNSAFNTAVGLSALTNQTTGGTANTAIGRFALNASITGFSNTAVGHQAMQNFTNGGSNVAVGSNAMAQGAIGNGNVAVGNLALFQNVGSNNTGIGGSALANHFSGSSNTAIGSAAMLGLGNVVTSGNTALGADAGRFVLTGTTQLSATTNSIFIGANTRGTVNATNEIVVGTNVGGGGSNTTTIGNTATTGVTIYGSITGTSFVKSGGTSAQFLKADGSSDSTDYFFNSRTVRNQTGSPLTAGTIVEINSFTGGIANVSKANANNFIDGQILIINETIANNATGIAVLANSYTFDTTAFAPNDTLYVGLNGGFQNNTSGLVAIITIGKVITSALSGTVTFNTIAFNNYFQAYNFNTTTDINEFYADLNLFGNSITATTFVKSGGTSIQSLMADGSVSEHYSGSFGGGISVSPSTGTTTPVANNSIFTKIGDVVIVNLGFSFSITAATPAQTYTVTIPLPFARSSSTQRFIGQVSAYGGLTKVAPVLDSSSTTNATFLIEKTIGGTETFLINATYQYSPLI